MRKMYKSILSKGFLAISLFGALALAEDIDCHSRTFDIKIAEQASAGDVLNQLSNNCNFSILIKDNYAKERLDIKDVSINIKNKSLKSIFDILIKENTLDYSFDNGLLKISGLMTKTFKLDYISSRRNAETSISATTDGGGEGSGGGTSQNSINTSEEFDFWAQIETEIAAILNSHKLSTTRSKNAGAGGEEQGGGGGGAEQLPVINKNAGLVTVTATRHQLDEVGKYISEMDRRLRKQVLIDVSIIDVSLGKDKSKGVDWDKFQLGFTSAVPTPGAVPGTSHMFTLNSRGNDSMRHSSGATLGFQAGLNMSGVLNFLQGYGNVKVVANPKILAINNQAAIISVGDNINYQTIEKREDGDKKTASTTTSKSTFVGYLLNILPEISDDDTVMLRISPSLSALIDMNYVNRPAAQRELAPDVRQKKLSTVARIKDGQTIVLGGLINDHVDKGTKGVPGLSKIPLIGLLFGHKKDVALKNEIVFVITPHIIDLDTYKASQSVVDLGYGDGILERQSILELGLDADDNK